MNNNLKQYRQKAGLSQGELAKALKMTSGQYVLNVERGKCFLSPKLFPRASKALNVSVNQLVNDHMEQYRNRLERKLKIEGARS